MDARSLTLTLLLTFLSPLSASHSPSPSPSPSLGPSLSPPKQLTGDPAGIGISPPESILVHNSPPPPPPLQQHHHHLRPPSCAACGQVDAGDRKLNFGQMMGIVLGGIAVALQVALGGFLVYKRLQLRKVERRGRTRLTSSSTSSTA